MMYSFFVFSPLGEIGTVIAKYQETRASLENLERILAQEPAPRNPGGAVPQGIESLEFSRVTYRHPGAREAALTDVTFEVRAGESVAFVGPSGAGQEHAHQAASSGCTSPNQGPSASTGSIPGKSTTTSFARGSDSFPSQSSFSRGPSATTCASSGGKPRTRSAWKA